MTFEHILKDIRKQAFSERDKGYRFEKLMKAYLQTDPLYANQIQDVWLWNEFPYRNDFSGKDTGIDIVAKTHQGDYWAVQCKCYDDTQINKDSVDSFLATSSKSFKDDELQRCEFIRRYWISTTNKWGLEAELVIQNQNPPVSRISLTDLINAPVDWEKLLKGHAGSESRLKVHKLKEHQKEALAKAQAHYKDHDRGKMIMACGTGKTFTSLRLAEQETQGKGLVLFLVPSISLLGQTLREWSAQATEPINAICVCSDSSVSKASEDTARMSLVDLLEPASTNPHAILKQLERYDGDSKKTGLTVVFSTYQSIDVVSRAQKKYKKPFDLIICDEAHRTTGVTLSGDEESAFVKVHDNTFLPAQKRLYMTATPRIYTEMARAKAQELDAELCSMDNPEYYGEEFYRIGFGKSVEKHLLSDYKVLILTVHEQDVPASFQKSLAAGTHGKEILADDVMKLAGCINALSKRTIIKDTSIVRDIDPEPMRRAVAFTSSIKSSKAITETFNAFKDTYYNEIPASDRNQLVDVSADHVDGTMSSLTRDEKLSWVKTSPHDGKECRILSNVRCLSEGVDVPTLDAVLFLSPRNSQVDVVQSVGRVMRTAPGKKYGYIIIPVVIPSGMSPEEALDDNDRFKVVWTVLNALRAHDDRFDAIINRINLNKRLPDQIQVVSSRGESSVGQSWEDEEHTRFQEAVDQARINNMGSLCHVIFARMVEKVGSKKYWEQWAKDVAQIAERHIQQINGFIGQDGKQKQTFDSFLKGLRQNINPSITEDAAIQMLAQHLITKPVFDALFDNYAFVKNNPVSKAMQTMLDKLDQFTLEKDRAVLREFYESVKMRTQGIDNGEAKQKIIVELYDKFFKTAFPKVVEQLGIVYTPIEVVDFIIHSVADVLKSEFSRDISDENIHILDPFTGTGTFITRLIQSGRISPKAIERKYSKELHANEIVLLAYYIASINIENAYHDLHPETDYVPFEGICLTDTFQLGEGENELDLNDGFFDNTKRVKAQRKAPLKIIIGNPPYSVGQKSANDNAQNQNYPKLESRIEETYAAESKAVLTKSLYDSYIKAFRWASDRLDPQGGIIAFVSNGAWLDGNAMDGFRKILEKEFSAIYIFNLRGNQRTSGELSRREGGKIFGSGSRTPIAITLLVKNPAAKTHNATIYYHDIGDYLTRERKLELVSQFRSIANMRDKLQILHPNKHGDWINHRDEGFEELIPLAPEKKFNQNSQSVFTSFAIGISTNRDAWVYNYSKKVMHLNMQKMIQFYNEKRLDFHREKVKNNNIKWDDVNAYQSTRISWTAGLLSEIERDTAYDFNKSLARVVLYRPFCKQIIYSVNDFIERPGVNPKFFPTSTHENLVICVSGIGVTKDFTAIITDCLPDLELIGKSQCFPLYYYEESEEGEQMSLYGEEEKYTRRDGVSDFIHKRVQSLCGPKVSKEDIFYYVYGVLHSEEYRTKYAVNLKKSLPRLPLPEEPKLFWEFSKSGRKLADLHLNYETLKPYPLREDSSKPNPSYRVEKMRFAKRGKEEDKTTIIYNDQITLWEIPLEAYGYVVNGKSAIEWIMERYQVTVHKESQIKNDPNLWCEEQGDPRYIIDLIKRIVTLSLETQKIVKSLPKLGL